MTERANEPSVADAVDGLRSYRVIVLLMLLPLFAAVGVFVLGLIAFNSDMYWLRHIVVSLQIYRPLLVVITMIILPIMGWRIASKLGFGSPAVWVFVLFVPIVSFFATFALGSRVRDAVRDSTVRLGWFVAGQGFDPHTLRPWLFLYSFAFQCIGLSITPIVVREFTIDPALTRDVATAMQWTLLNKGIPAAIVSVWIALTFPRPLRIPEALRLSVYCLAWGLLPLFVVWFELGDTPWSSAADRADFLSFFVVATANEFAMLFAVFLVGRLAASLLRRRNQAVGQGQIAEQGVVDPQAAIHGGDRHDRE